MPAPRDRSSALPYLLDPQFDLWITGRWNTGGLLEVYYTGEFVEVLDLPPAKWALLAALANQARRAQGNSPMRGFMTVDELVAALRKHTHLQLADPLRVVRLVYELRQTLDKAKAQEFQKTWGQGAREWGKRMIETHRLGYRVSHLPDNIHTEILDASSDSLPSCPSSPGEDFEGDVQR